MMPLKHGRVEQTMFRLANVLSLGLYTHREKATPEMQEVFTRNGLLPLRESPEAFAGRVNPGDVFILNDPFVQQMQRDFGAKIVPGSIKPVTGKH